MEEINPPGLPDGNETDDSLLDEVGDPTNFLILTRRLRCLFGVLTCPIVPLGTLVVLALLYLLYAAIWVDRGGLFGSSGCSHPLHLFVWVTIVIAVYTPNHAFLRRRLPQNQSLRRRRFDQIFQTVLLLYVYAGITLVQTCRSDDMDSEAPQGNSCQMTCPTLSSALTVYVTALELFTLSLILPLLFLPCIYIWFLRSAMADQEALAVFQRRLREDDDDNTLWFRTFSGGRRRRSQVTMAQVMEKLYPVRLVQRDDERVSIVPDDTALPESFAKEGARECCICMTQFFLSEEDDDIETGEPTGPNSPRRSLIVQARSCGHLFHRSCISSWIGGRWETPQRNETQRLARRTTCPLCRSDLQNTNRGNAHGYGTFG